MKALLISTAIIIAASAASAITPEYEHRLESKEVYEVCKEMTGYTTFENADWNAMAKCKSEWLAMVKHERVADTRKFLKENPEYTWPGGSAGMPHPLSSEVAIARDKVWSIRNRVPTYNQLMQERIIRLMNSFSK